MGIILSRFRKKKSTVEILEDLDAQIKKIRQYGQSTEQRHKKIVGTIVIYGVILYIMIAFIFYFCFFPASLHDQLFYIIPLLLFPILIILTKKMTSWYYNRKITENREKLVTIQEEKKKILDEVTETETYKKAKEILLKFAPDELHMSPLTPKTTQKLSIETPLRSMPQSLTPRVPDSGELRKRVISTQNLPQNMRTPSLIATPSAAINQSPHIPFQSRTINPALIGFRSPLPRPVLPQQRTVIDRLVDYIVGDGPSNRYALICRQCESHNGMALREEFEYFAFRCCYCGFWNPARKQKPSAPKLDFDNDNTVIASGTCDAISSEADEEPMKNAESDTDSDIEVVEKPETSETSESPESETKQSLGENESDESDKTQT